MRLPEAVLITGANGHTAIACARDLLGRGCKVLLMYHQRRDRLDELVKDYTNSVFTVQVDLSDYIQTKYAYKQLTDEAGVIPEGIIHTAAIRSYDAKPLLESDPILWQEIIGKNIAFAYNILRSVLPQMAGLGKGKVILLGSNVTRTGLPYGSAYAAGKTALGNLVRSVAWEMAPLNIQINQVSPGPLDIDLEQDYEGDYLAFRKQYFASYKSTHPAKQLVQLNDLSEVITGLLNLDITSVSGEEIYLTGGVL